MLEWLHLVFGLLRVLIGRNPLGESIGQAPKPLRSGTAISKVQFALESEQPRRYSRKPARRKVPWSYSARGRSDTFGVGHSSKALRLMFLVIMLTALSAGLLLAYLKEG